MKPITVRRTKKGVGPQDLMALIYLRRGMRFTELWKEFKGKCAYQTFINHKKQLEAQGKIKKKIDEETGKIVYYVPEEFREEAEECITKQLIEKLPTNFLKEFMKRYKITIINEINWGMCLETPYSIFKPAKDEDIKKWEERLRKSGFSEEEIIKMWLYDEGRYLEELFFCDDPLLKDEEEIKRIKNELKNIEIIQKSEKGEVHHD